MNNGMTIWAFLKNNVNAGLRFLNALKRPSREANLQKLHELKESLDSFIIRDVRPDEIEALSELHVKTWNETYPGVRHKPSVELREKQWAQVFNKNDNSWFCLFMINMNDNPVGFVYGLKYDRPDILPYEGQISKIYLLQSYTALGLGKKLMYRAAEEFQKRGMKSIVLFASADNPSCGFYDAMNGTRLYSVSGQFDGGYGWSDLNELLKK